MKPQTLIGRAPDPVGDRQILDTLGCVGSPAAHRLAIEMRLREEWCSSRLGALLPGLDLMRSPRLGDLLGVRAANALGRGRLISWGALAGSSPSSLAALPGAGQGTVEEVLAVAIREWAGAYLRSGRDGTHPECTHDEDPEPGVDKSHASVDLDLLAQAFAELEGRPAFEILRRRELQPGHRPTLATIASEMGVSRELVRVMQAKIRRRLLDPAQVEYRPIRLATEAVRARLGSVARAGEPTRVFSAIDPDAVALRASSPHRARLLLSLADYRFIDGWVLGPDIEGLTRAVLLGLAHDPEGTDLEAAGRHLSRLGIREEIQLPWIADQPGFRIVGGWVLTCAEAPDD